jgi:regulatory protein
MDDEDDDEPRGRSARGRSGPPRPKPPVTQPYLQRVAAWYLERYEATSGSLRRALLKRVHRGVETHGQDREQLTAWADQVVAGLCAAGAVDDRRYVETAIRRGRERGDAERKIRSKLLSKGLPGSLIDELFTERKAEPEGPSDERLAAIRFARKRRFGPWRRPGAPEDVGRKELAAMGRAGYSYALANELVRATDAEALEDELPRGW